MGSVVGEKITAAAERAAEENLPFVVITASGGARMQEGMVSLVQMAKTSAALAKLDEAGGLYIVVATDPTTAGVAASFASLGDIILAEPGAMMGFAGPRVIKNTIRAELPEGFQTAEFMLEKGFIDRIVPRAQLGREIARIIDYCGK
jgi:acetyl-CoA carboxylase carboxyl transferase subunit beta